MAFNSHDVSTPGAKIKVIGVGGGGTNAVSTMIRANIEGVDFVAANTDMQSLRFALAPNKLQIGKELTKGLGAGADPDVGRDAALEDRHEISEAIAGADMAFITAGMGGGTGTGGAAVVSQIARENGALTVAVVTKPFSFEGKRRQRHAELGIARLREHVDTLIVIPNDRLLKIATPDLSMLEAFKMADNVLVNAVKGISDIINVPGTINVDFADVKTIMSSTGQALMGIGTAQGQNRAVEAARKAISSPLLEDVDIEGATGILINITAAEQISLVEINEACSIVQEAAHEDANIIFGAVIDENMGSEIRVTVIATGFPGESDNEVLREKTQALDHRYRRPSHQGSLKIPQPIPRPKVKEIIEVKEEAKPKPSSLNTDDLTRWTFESLDEEPPLEKSAGEYDAFQLKEETVDFDFGIKTSEPAAIKEEVSLKKESVEEKSLDPLKDELSQINAEFDKKIDEALEMAEKVRQSDHLLDQLDIPAFLRRNKQTTVTTSND